VTFVEVPLAAQAQSAGASIAKTNTKARRPFLDLSVSGMQSVKSDLMP
jgi:hypothetical protein